MLKLRGAFSVKYLNFSLFLFTLALLGGCQEGGQFLPQNSTQPEEEAVTLTFLISPWPPDAINYLAQEKGFFKKHGVNVELLWADGYEETFSQVEDGSLDVWNTTLLDAVNYHSTTGVGQAIWLEDSSAGADALVTLQGNQIDSIADLKGKRVGAESGTVGEFFLQILLGRQGLNLSDLTIVDTGSEEVVDKLISKEIDAGVCYEPCPTEILNSGGMVLVNSAKERGLIVDVYVAREDHMEKHKESYVKAFRAIAEAQEYFRQNKEESALIMQEVLKMSPEDILASFDGLRVANLRDNQTALNRSSGFSSLYNLARLAGQYLQEREILHASFDTDQVISSEIVDSLSQ